MLNVLLEDMPEEYEGYRIAPDFRTGILISMCLSDPELTELEQRLVAVNLLFTDKIPPPEQAMSGISWFMNANNHDNYEGVKQSEVILMDYGVDQWRIYAAFMAQYHIDLNKVDMHWFIFRGLLDNLSECSFTDVMQLRQKKIPAYLSAKEKEEFKRKQKIFQLGKTGKVKEDDFTESEKARIAEFLKYANIKR